MRTNYIIIDGLVEEGIRFLLAALEDKEEEAMKELTRSHIGYCGRKMVRTIMLNFYPR